MTVVLNRERLKGYTVCDCGVEQRETGEHGAREAAGTASA